MEPEYPLTTFLPVAPFGFQLPVGFELASPTE